MDLRWFKNHDVDAKAKFKQQLLNGSDVLDRLKEILTEMYDSSLTESEKIDKYTSNWPYYQADQIGTRRTLRKLIDLVTLTEE